MRLHIDTSDSVVAWTADWKRLWHEVGGNPFLHPGWHSAFVESQRGDLRPLIVGVREGDALRGLLPMRRDVDGVLRFLTSPRSDYEDALASTDLVHEVMRCLAAFLAKEKFELGEVPEASPLARALQGHGLKSVPSSKCPGIQLSAEKVQDIAGRKHLRRDERLLARHGPVRLVEVSDDRIAEALDAFMDQHVSRWLAMGDPSMFLEERNRDFYRRLLTRHDFREFGRLQVLLAGERDSAYHLALLGRDTFVMYKPTFDLNLEAESPGKLLLKRLIEHAYEAGNTYFDFSRGDEDYKRRFATEVRQNLRFSRRVPLPPRIAAVIARRLRRELQDARAWIASRTAIHSNAMVGSLFQLAVPATCPDTPGGFRAQFGSIDLVAFGAMQRHISEYVTTQRMRSAVARRRRGDRLLVVFREDDGQPIHFSWLRTRVAVTEQPGNASTGDPEPTPARAFDLWTAPSYRESNIDQWTLRRLAWEVAQSGQVVQVWCAARDTATRRNLASAGVCAELREYQKPSDD